MKHTEEVTIGSAQAAHQAEQQALLDFYGPRLLATSGRDGEEWTYARGLHHLSQQILRQQKLLAAQPLPPLCIAAHQAILRLGHTLNRELSADPFVRVLEWQQVQTRLRVVLPLLTQLLAPEPTENDAGPLAQG